MRILTVDGGSQSHAAPLALAGGGGISVEEGTPSAAATRVCAMPAHEEAFGTRVQRSALMEGLGPRRRLRLWA